MLAELIYLYVRAKTELEKAQADCEGSWGYYLWDQQERVDDLAKQIEDYHPERKE